MPKMFSTAGLIVITVFALALTGCGDAREEAFISKCSPGMGDSKACSCFYDIAVADLSDKQIELLQAMMTGDKKTIDRIGEELGTFGTIAAQAKIAVATGKAVGSCDLKT